ncbi:MAG: GAF domain-containing sensor histidine kinase [Chloroflexota bacterium]
MTQSNIQLLDDVQRLHTLQRTQLLDSPVEDSFDRITSLASRIVGAPISFVSLVEPDRQFIKSQVGLPEPLATIRQTPIDYSLCQHVVKTGHPLIIEDARQDPLVKDNPSVTEGNVVAYLGIPLTTNEGWHLGSLCVIDDKPRQWTSDDIDTMQTLATSVASEIQLRLDSVEMQHLVAQLQKHNRDLDEFSHTVSHNLKNGISAIIGWTDISRRYANQISREDLLDNMDKIRGLAQHTDETINALLLLAKIDRMENLPIEQFSMQECLETVLTRLELQFTEYRATVNLPDVMHDSLGYPEWVIEIWMNYISNALKYGGKPPHITIGSEILDDCVRYWVKDNGKGISQEDAGRLFKSFSRLEQTADVEGHGLGLSIVKRIAEKLGGSVSVESKVGKGSTFNFTLPIE